MGDSNGRARTSPCKWLPVQVFFAQDKHMELWGCRTGTLNQDGFPGKGQAVRHVICKWVSYPEEEKEGLPAENSREHVLRHKGKENTVSLGKVLLRSLILVALSVLSSFYYSINS